jgi:hypothetical protein
MDPDCLSLLAAQPEGHRATLPSGPDPKCVGSVCACVAFQR